MPPRASVYQSQFSVPVLQAPEMPRIDVSSGVMALAGQTRQVEDKIQTAHKATMLSDAQTQLAQGARQIDEENRRLPWDQKVQHMRDGFQKLRENVLDAIPDQEVKQAFKPEFERTYGSYDAHTSDDAFKGEADHNIANAQATSQAQAEAFAKARTPQEKELALQGMRNAWATARAGGYIDETQEREQVSKSLGASQMFAVQELIQKNPWQAKKALADPAKVFDQFPGLDPAHLPTLQNQADAEAHSREAEARANAAQSRMENAQDAMDLIKSDLSSRQLTGKSVITGTNDATVRAGLTTKQYAAYQSAAQKADAVFAATSDFRQIPTAQIMGKLETLKPKGGEADFEDRQAAYKAATAIASDVIKDRNSDPAASVREAFPKVASQWRIYETTQQTGNLRDALKATRAAQTSVGIAEQDQKLIPDAMADHIAGQIANTDAAKAGQALKSYAEQFGAYWPKVYQQLSPKLDPAVKVGATIEDPGARALLLDTSRQPRDKVRTANGLKEHDLTDIIASDPTYNDFAQSVGPYGINNNSSIDMAQSIETLALGYMTTRGMGKDAAVNQAVKDTLGKYKFGAVNGRTFAAPAGSNIYDIEAKAAGILRKIDASKFDFAHSGIGGSSREDELKTWQNGLRRNGFWVSLPGLKGLRLYSDRGAVLQYGKPIDYTWDQIKAGSDGNSPSEGAYLGAQPVPPESALQR